MTDSIVKTFVKAIKAEKKDPSPYDTTAKVTRVDGNTVWVHISGGVDETPVRRTVNAKVGDEVQVRVGGGKAWITGNASSPPTDDTRAIKADTNAIRAKDIADSAFNYAETAADAAGRAITSATQAASAAASAQTSANNAQTSANNAAEYASRALGGLSTVQSVAETLTWITQHGTMALTTDVALDPTHVYFVLDPAGDYTVGGNTYAIVTEPNVNDIGTYYELTIDESLNNYVGTHLALTNEGLWLLPASSGTNKVLVATGAGTTYTTAGTYIIDSGGATVASFRSDGISLGDATSYKFDVDLSGVKLTQNINGTNYEMLDLGYDSSVPAPERVTRYSLGSRKTTSTAYSSSGTYNVGDMCLYDDKVWVCNTAITTPEAFNTSHWDKYIGGTSFATGSNPIASGTYSFCEGQNNIAIGEAAHAEGYNTIARGDYSHASGEGTLAYQNNQFVIGKYNTNTLGSFIIGNGTADNARSNAFVVSSNGDVYAAGNINIASGCSYMVDGVPIGGGGGGGDVTGVKGDAESTYRTGNVNLTAADIGAISVPSGGTSGQVLTKNSNTDYDLTWTTPSTGPSEYDYTTTITPSIDARGVTAANYYVTPTNTADLTVANARKVEAYLEANFTAYSYSGAYRLYVTRIYIDTANNRFNMMVKSHNSSPQLTSTSYITGTLHIVAPFEISSVTAGK